MSKEIEIIYDAPIIFTKDQDWVADSPVLEPGAIIVLPEDAVLYVPQKTQQINTELFPPPFISPPIKGE